MTDVADPLQLNECEKQIANAMRQAASEVGGPHTAVEARVVYRRVVAPLLEKLRRFEHSRGMIEDERDAALYQLRLNEECQDEENARLRALVYQLRLRTGEYVPCEETRPGRLHACCPKRQYHPGSCQWVQRPARKTK